MVERSKRERKSTEHFIPSEGPKEVKKAIIQEGRGTKLGDIPNINFKLDGLKGGDEVLENLHSLVYKYKGKASTRKREVKAFSGFVFDEGSEETERKRIEARLSKWTVNQLNAVLDVLDAPRGTGADGSKEKKVERIMDFLTEPKALSEVDLAAKATAKKEKAARAKAKKQKVATKPEPAKKAKREESKKSPGVTKKTPTKSQAKATPKKPASGKKRAAVSEPDDSKIAKRPKKAENQEATPAAKKLPSDQQIQQDTAKILEDAIQAEKDLTTKEVYNQLGKKYGLTLADIKKKKDLIKAVCSKHIAGEEENAPKVRDTDILASSKEAPVGAGNNHAAGSELPEAAEVDDPPAASSPEKADMPQPAEAEAQPQENLAAPAHQGAQTAASEDPKPQEEVHKATETEPTEEAETVMQAAEEPQQDAPDTEAAAPPEKSKGLNDDNALVAGGLEDVDKYINQF